MPYELVPAGKHHAVSAGRARKWKMFLRGRSKNSRRPVPTEPLAHHIDMRSDLRGPK